MSTTVSNLSGLQKAGVLLMSLGAEASAKVFDHLTPEERELLGSEIVKLRHVDNVVRRRVLDEVNAIVKQHSMPAFVTVGEAATPGISDEPLRWLDALDPREVAVLIASERAQNVALVLAHISPHNAAVVLSNLKENVRNQVANRLAAMKPVSREAIEAVDEAMRRRVGAPTSNRENKPSILNGAAQRVSDSVRGALGKVDTNSLPKIPRSFSVPEDIAQLNDSEIKTALAEMDFDDLCLVMRVGGEDMRMAVLRNASEEAGLTLHREIASTSQIRVREIERAQLRIVEALNKLFGDGQALEAVVG
ncbi:MAG: hypothetical protein NT018_10740 [Armatimonadetes bacterium]|nr:hypothetical protein [Armatimonadota bacterium]